MNKLLINGRLTKDPEVRYGGEKNTAVAKFTIASERKFKKDGEQNADFIPCVAFGKSAEFLEKYGRKGSKYIIEGRMTSGSYKNKDNITVYTLECAVESIEFGESNKKPESAPDDDFLGIPDIPDDELPFV